MRRVFWVSVSVAVVCLFFGMAWAQDNQKGSAAEAKIMVEKGYEYLQKNGVKAAAEEFMKPAGPFRKKDLYISMADFKGNLVCYPPKPASVGRNALFQKDSDGSSIVQKIIDAAKAKGTGWVDYKWLHPKSKETEQKTTYFKKVNDNLVMYCGAYK